MCPSIASVSVCILHQLHCPNRRILEAKRKEARKPEICVWDDQNKSHTVWPGTMIGVNNQKRNRLWGMFFQMGFVVCEKKGP